MSVLEQLELQSQREVGEAEVSAIQLNDGRHADVGLDQGMGLLDRGPVYRGCHRRHDIRGREVPLERNRSGRGILGNHDD